MSPYLPLTPVPSDSIAGPQRKKALLSISDGRASSFFNTFLKIITPHPFYRQRIFGCKYTKKNRDIQRKSEKIGEIQRKSEKIRDIQIKSEIFIEKRRKSEKIRENRRKIEIICKFLCISVRFICKFMGISVRIICKSMLISVRFVSFFCSKSPTPQGSFTFLHFTFKCPCRKNRNYYLCTMRLPESER